MTTEQAPRETRLMPPVRVRVVVVGETTSGVAAVTSDEVLAPAKLGVFPGAAFFRVWGSAAPPTLPTAGARTPGAWIPASGEVRFGVSILPPAYGAGAADLHAGLDEIRRHLPGLAETLDLARPGMHRTDTVDLVLVASGEVVLELDEGAEVALAAGDCVVQFGARHAWRNRSAAPCTLVITMLGVVREPATDPASPP